MSSASELRAIALTQFASAGYTATSIQTIAELAGLSKSSVLYHYSSKEALLEAAISPALMSLDGILDSVADEGFTGLAGPDFTGRFIDFLLEYRLEVHLFINQGPSLEDVPVVERANALVERLVSLFADDASTLEEKMRVGIALGGAAYILANPFKHEDEFANPVEVRAALVTILGELIAPVTA